jgi:hypothetical protein
MQGNKGQIGNSWTGLKVITKKDKKECIILKIMTDEEYKQSNSDYKKYFTLKDNNGNIFQCSRNDFLIPKK